MAKKSVICFISLLSLIIFNSCANQMRPKGGEIDTIPPEVLRVYPKNKTINFNDDYISIEFSEYVKKSASQDAVFISPPIDGNVEYNWSGTTLDIEFDEVPLRTSQTYVVTIGTDVADLNNNNNMKSSYTFSFSTGGKLDKGVINGKVYDKNPLGISVFGYILDSLSVDPTEKKPDYITQTGKDGSYKLIGLANGKYKLFAVRDEFKNNLYDIDDDQIGIPFKRIELTEKDSIVYDVNLMVTKNDTSKPHVLEVTMTDESHILVEFTEPVDSSALTNNNFTLIDSTTKTSFNPEFVFKGKAKNKQLFISFSDSLIEANNNHLLVSNFKDRFGNINRQEIVPLVVNTKPDTVFPSIIRQVTALESGELSLKDQYIKLYFDDGINNDKFYNAIELIDEKENKLDKRIEKLDDASFQINLIDELYPKTNFKLNVNFSKVIDAKGNSLDSTITYNFKTESGLDYSGVSGNIYGNDSVNTILILKNTENDIFYKNEGLNKYKFTNVKPGKYQLWGFIDENDDNKYSYGKLFPYERSENFVYFIDTLKLRARWPVGNINLRFNDGGEVNK